MNGAFQWPDLERQGFELLADGQSREAARCWIEATRHFVNDAKLGDPCFALVQNNAGVGCLFLGETAEAPLFFKRAADAWEQVVVRIESEGIEASGRSSSHHLRLQLKHEDAFQEALRSRARRVAQAGAEIARANMAMTQGALHPSERQRCLIAEGLGERSYAAVMARAAEDADPAALTRATRLHDTAALAFEMLGCAWPLSFWQRVDRAAELSLLADSQHFTSQLSPRET